MTPATDFRVSICGIPELDAHRGAAVTHVLSILDPDWPDPAAFDAFPPHRRLALRFHDVIEAQPRLLPPSRADVERLLAFGRDMEQGGACHLLVHCHAGISRSTAAAALIVAQAHPQWPAASVFDAVTRVRPAAWPNLRMLEYGDDLLGRGGEIVAAVASVYRRAIERDPSFADAMVAGNRSREVAAGLGAP